MAWSLGVEEEVDICVRQGGLLVWWGGSMSRAGGGVGRWKGRSCPRGGGRGGQWGQGHDDREVVLRQ